MLSAPRSGQISEKLLGSGKRNVFGAYLLGQPGLRIPEAQLAGHLSPFGFRKHLPAFDLLPGAQAAFAEAAVLVDSANIDAGRLGFIFAYENRIPIDLPMTG
jgi:hypothetical protein